MRRLFLGFFLLAGCGFGSGLLDDDDTVPDDDDAVLDDDDSAALDDDDDVDEGLILINEIMSSNESTVMDDRGFFVDWLEIVNTTPEDVDLAGWSLTDDWEDPTQAVLPDGVVVQSGERIVLWASETPGAGPLHLPFGLSLQGESVGLFAPDGAAVDWVEFPGLETDQAYARLPDAGPTWLRTPLATPGENNGTSAPVTQSLVERGAVWKYRDGDVDLGTEWRALELDDADWSEGPAPLGYGDPVETEISFGDDPQDKAITAYFRHTFESAGSGDVAGAELFLELRKDDGAVVYINGREAARQGMGDGVVDSDTRAAVTASGAAETAYTPEDLDPAMIVEGTNVIAVEVHQVGSNSSDLQMDLSLTLTSTIEPD